MADQEGVAFAGDLGAVSVAELLRTVGDSGKSGVARVETDAGIGRIWFRNGHVIDAEFGDAAAAAAVRCLLDARRGRFEVEHVLFTRRQVIVESIDELIRSCRSRENYDETVREMPALDSVVRVDQDRVARARPFLAAEDLALLGKANGRRTIIEVIDDSGLDVVQALDRVSRLFRDALLVVGEPVSSGRGQRARHLAAEDDEAIVFDVDVASRPGHTVPRRPTPTYLARPSSSNPPARLTSSNPPSATSSSPPALVPAAGSPGGAPASPPRLGSESLRSTAAVEPTPPSVDAPSAPPVDPATHGVSVPREVAGPGGARRAPKAMPSRKATQTLWSPAAPPPAPAGGAPTTPRVGTEPAAPASGGSIVPQRTRTIEPPPPDPASRLESSVTQPLPSLEELDGGLGQLRGGAPVNDHAEAGSSTSTPAVELSGPASVEGLEGSQPGSGRGSTILGRYEVISRIARGGMGTVYLCRVTGEGGFRRLFALKVLREHLGRNLESVELFLQEAMIASRLHHPNVVSIVDVGSVDGQHFLVMDYVEGCSLADLLKKHPGPASPRLVVSILLDVLGGLGAAHSLADDDGSSLRLVHCDLSPHNMLIGADGICRITDFGIAKATGALPYSESEITRGKPGYLSPEQIHGGVIDPRSDLFVIGVVLWNALTGETLFEASTVERTLANVLHQAIPRPSTRPARPPAALDDVIMKALERDPSARFQSADAMLRALRAAALSADLLALHDEVSAWVMGTFGRQLELRRLSIADAARRPSTSTDQAIPALPKIGRQRLSSIPPAPAEPLTALGPADVSQTIVLDRGEAAKVPTVVAGALAVVVVALGIVWPNALGRLFAVDSEMKTSDDIRERAHALVPSASPPTSDRAPVPSASGATARQPTWSAPVDAGAPSPRAADPPPNETPRRDSKGSRPRRRPRARPHAPAVPGLPARERGAPAGGTAVAPTPGAEPSAAALPVPRTAPPPVERPGGESPHAADEAYPAPVVSPPLAPE